MNTADAREAFIKACEDAEDAEPVNLPNNTPVVMGGARYRASYDGLNDAIVLITEEEWKRRLVQARSARNEVRVTLKDGQHARVIAGRSVWIIGWDDTVDDFTAVRVDKAAR